MHAFKILLIVIFSCISASVFAQNTSVSPKDTLIIQPYKFKKDDLNRLSVNAIQSSKDDSLIHELIIHLKDTTKTFPLPYQLLIKENIEGFPVVSSEEIIPLLLQALQTTQQELTETKQKMETYREELINLKTNLNTIINLLMSDDYNLSR